MNLCVVFTLSLYATISFANAGTYVFTAPRIARTDTKYKSSITLTVKVAQQFSGSLNFTSLSNSSYSKLQVITFAANEKSKEIETDMSMLPPGKYSLKLTLSIPDYLVPITNSAEIELVDDPGFTMIQTDKGIYKRSQRVKFRVVSLGPDMKPETSAKDITIEDPDGTKVERFSDEKNSTGVITKYYQLIDEPKQGTWKIVVDRADGKGKQTVTTFEVDDYVLPRFEVEVKLSRSYVFIDDFQPIDVDVVGTYTYGEPVIGMASVEIKMRKFDGTYIQHVQASSLRDGVAKFKITESMIGDVSGLRRQLCSNPYCYIWGQQSFPLNIHATVIENISNEQHDMNSTVDFYTRQAALKVTNKKERRRNLPFTVYIEATDPSGGALPDNERQNYAVNITIGPYYSVPVFEAKKAELPLNTPEAVLQFHVNETSESRLKIKASLYMKSTNMTVASIDEFIDEYQSGDKSQVQIDLLNSDTDKTDIRSPTKVFNVGDRINVLARGYAERGFFGGNLHLFLFARGKVIKTHEVSPNTTTHIDITQEMGLAPSASLLLYGVSSANELVADEMELMVSGLIQNQMSMSFDKEREEVGKYVKLSGTTHPNANIFLVAIDKGSQLLKAPNDITEMQVEDGMKSLSIRQHKKPAPLLPRPMFRRKRQTYYEGIAAKGILERVGVIYMTDQTVAQVSNVMEFPVIAEAEIMPDGGNRKNSEVTVPVDEIKESSNQIRKFFPETWIWLDRIVGSDGKYEEILMLPDTITSWTARGFSISKEKGIGIASNAQIEGFKNFFVVVSLPSSAINGEKMEVKLVVFNYYGENKDATIIMEQSSDYDIFVTKASKTAHVGNYQKDIKVQRKLSNGTNLFIFPKTLGNIKIRVRVSTRHLGLLVTDVVEKLLIVDPPGKTHYFSNQELFYATPTPQTKRVNPIFPSNSVQGSRKISVSVTGNIMGQPLENIGRLVRVPIGCGEQNMIMLVPNINVVSYLEGMSLNKPELKARALENMQYGYTRELNYMHENGGFSAFPTDKSHSTWLTAFVLKSFAQAKPYIVIDNEVLLNASKAIISAYDTRIGYFKEPGKVIHTDLTTGTGKDEMLTAYVYLSLLEAERAGVPLPDRFNQALTLTYLETFYEQNKKGMTPFKKAVLSYCFALGKSTMLSEILDDLQEMSTKTTNAEKQCWCDLKTSDDGHGHVNYYTHDSKPSDIETASYVLFTYLELNDMTNARPILKWLMTQLNDKGGCFSTQDTIVGIYAISWYAKKLGWATSNINVDFRSGGQKVAQFTLDDDNSILYQREDLTSILDQLVRDNIDISVSGTGNAMVSVHWQYNTEDDEELPDLHITVETFRLTYGNEIKVCYSYTGAADLGMFILELILPTGYAPYNLEKLNSDSNIQRAEMEDRKMNMYFNYVSRDVKCVNVEIIQMFEVVDIQPSEITAKSYYDPAKSVTAFYTLSDTFKPTGGSELTRAGSLMLFVITTISFLFTFV